MHRIGSESPAIPFPRSPVSGSVFILEMQLAGLPVWRKVSVPAVIRLPKLHRVIQAAFGWEDRHLHEFVGEDGTCYGHWLKGEDPPHDEAKVRLSEVLPARLGAVLRYRYDFGDDWDHRLILRGAETRDLAGAELLAGAGATPPEDCGGLSGYERMLAALADPTHEAHRQYRDWLPEGRFDPEAFAADDTQLRLNSVRL